MCGSLFYVGNTSTVPWEQNKVAKGNLQDWHSFRNRATVPAQGWIVRMEENPVPSEKIKMRYMAKSRLKSIGAAEKKIAAATMAQTVSRLDSYVNTKLILGFLSMPDEIDTADLIEKALADGKRVAVPRIEGDDIAFIELDAGWKSWPLDRWNIPEPPASLRALSPSAILAEPCLALIPGLAFDAKNMRLGRGKGFYDRFLAKIETEKRKYWGQGSNLSINSRFSFFTCGIGYACQRFESIPADSHDKHLDAIILV